MDKLCASRPCCSILGRISSSLFPLTCQLQVLGPTSEQRKLSFWFPWPVLRSDDGPLERSCAMLIFLQPHFLSVSERDVVKSRAAGPGGNVGALTCAAE